ncbi:MAG: DUF2345 domain-containing protein [Spongiibacteraceae bacterium]
MKLIAAKGDVLVQAQSNDVEITADKNVKITACKNTLTASAEKEFLLQSGGGYIRVSGGNVEIHCPGKLSMKAASFVHVGGGGGGGSVAVPMMPLADEFITYKDKQGEGSDKTDTDPAPPFDKGQKQKILGALKQ